MLSSHPLSSWGRNPPSPETVARARALVEGTGLSQGAIVRETGLSRRRLKRLMACEGWRRPPEAPCGRRGKPPALLARMQALVEGTALAQRAIARELRVSPGYVSHCIRRHGWARPRLEAAPGTAVAVRWPKRAGRPFRTDVVPRVRELYTGTVLPLKAIGARTGVSFAYVSKLARRYGWVRPEGAPVCSRDVSLHRAGLTRRIREGRRRVRVLAESWAAAFAAAPEAGAALARARALAARAEPARGPRPRRGTGWPAEGAAAAP